MTHRSFLALVALLVVAACSEPPQPLPAGAVILERTVTLSDRKFEVRVADAASQVFAETPAFLGRVFQESEHADDSRPVAIVSYAFWQALGADLDVLGKEIEITSGVRRTIVGVTPEGFGSIEGVDIFFPVP